MTQRSIDLVAFIERSRARFEDEVDQRAKYLTYRRETYVVDPLEPDGAAITKLALHYREVRRRYERRFGKPRPKFVPKVKRDERDWRSTEWRLDANNRPLSTIENALKALRDWPELSGVIGLNSYSGKIYLKARLPWDHWDVGKEFEMRRLRDDDLTGILEYLQAEGLATLTRDDCLAAVRRIARENEWRPEE